MTDKRYYQINYPFENVGELRNSAEKIVSFLRQFDDETALENIPESIANKIIFLSEKSDLSLRGALEKQVNTEEYFYKKPVDYQPVSVNFDGNILTVKTPLTLKRSGVEANDRSNYILMNYVRAALEEWQDTNNISLYKSIDWPVTAFIIRKGNGYKTRKICDNDNIENGRIINEIFAALGYSDNVRIMDLYSKYECAADKQDIGTEFILVPKSNKEALNSIIYREQKS